MSELVNFVVHDDVGTIIVNNPPVNALSPGVPEGIAAGIEKAAGDPAVKGVVLIGGGKTFIAGADIKEFAKMVSGEVEPDKQGLHALLTTIEDSAKPVVCAIHGTAFGGGLEVAMACHYRVALATAKLGQPEVKLGIIPGGEGTQRLPRLIGVARAAEMCALGNPVDAKTAAGWGLVDEVVTDELLVGAMAYLHAMMEKGDPVRKTRERPLPTGDAAETAQALDQLKDSLARRARGQLAPLKAVEAVEAAGKLPFADGIKQEAEMFWELLPSPQCKALIHVFLGERQAGKIPGISVTVQPGAIRKAAIVGAGTMGGGIAMNYANAGIPVVIKETSADRLEQGISVIKNNYAETVQKGRLTQDEMDKRMALIKPTLNYDDFKDADIVTEAVFESLELKKQVFAELNQVMKPGAILATNTSTLSIDEIAAATNRPEWVIGTHFFSPANVMRLLEVVRGAKTNDVAITTCMALGKRLRKVTVLVGNCFGFVGNRMFGPYTREAEFLVEEGAKIQAVDQVLYDFGMAMGPLAVYDLAGLDIGWHIRQESKHLIPDGQRTPKVTDVLYEKGRYGQKTGAGWYRYETGSRTPNPDPEVEAIVRDVAQQHHIKQRTVDAQEILERTLYALINEGARVLEEGFALRAADIDTIYVNGYGFPAHRGGPMHYAGTIGLQKICDRLRTFEKELGFWWKPSELLQTLAAEGKTFAGYDQAKSA